MQKFQFIKKWWGVFAVIVLLLLGGAFLFYLNRSSAEVYPARIGKAVAAVYGTVKIEWLWTVNIRAQNSGYIHFAPGIYAGQKSVGTAVEKKQLLATISDEETARKIRQAKLDLEAAEGRRSIGPASIQELKTAKDHLERLLKLRDLNNVPAVKVQEAQNQVERIEGLVQSEQIELDQLVETLSHQLKTLQEKLGKSEIRSPIDGILTAVNNVDGELVFENNILFTVAMNSTYVLGQVNEEDVGSLRVGMKAKIRLYSFANQEFTATLTSILPSGDANTNQYSVILKMETPPANLMAGMTGEMNIILGEKENSLLVPTKALVLDRVMVVKNGTVVPRTVKPGYRSLEWTEIQEGIQEGDLVIIADQDIFSTGDHVRPIVVDTIEGER